MLLLLMGKKDELIAKDPKNKEIIKPILRGRDIKRYKAEFADLWIIMTHNGIKDKKSGLNIPRIDIKDYPLIKEHLDHYWEKLEKRCDQGDTPYNLRNCAYIKEFEKEKIVYQELTQGSRFAYDKKGEYFISNTAYLLTGKDIKFLIAFLNSKLIEYAFNSFICISIGKKGIRWLNQYMQELFIPELSKKQQKPFIALVDYILYAKEKGLEKEAKLFEQVIDNLIYDYYFEEEMKQAECYITDKVTSLIEPFNDNDSDESKEKYIKLLYKTINNDKDIYKGLIQSKNVKEVKIILDKLK